MRDSPDEERKETSDTSPIGFSGVGFRQTPVSSSPPADLAPALKGSVDVHVALDPTGRVAYSYFSSNSSPDVELPPSVERGRKRGSRVHERIAKWNGSMHTASDAENGSSPSASRTDVPEAPRGERITNPRVSVSTQLAVASPADPVPVSGQSFHKLRVCRALDVCVQMRLLLMCKKCYFVILYSAREPHAFEQHFKFAYLHVKTLTKRC